jgi:hypothetical protein
MSNIQNVFITLSFICWFGVAVFEVIGIQNNNKYVRFFIQIFLMVFIVVILHKYSGYFNTIEEKMDVIIPEYLTLCGLYISTIFGIVGHHIFIQIREVEERKRKIKIKWIPVIKPLIISPLIFLAVMTQLAQMGGGGEGLKANIMQFILAFQNGFFWKTIFENLKSKKE